MVNIVEILDENGNSILEDQSGLLFLVTSVDEKESNLITYFCIKNNKIKIYYQADQIQEIGIEYKKEYSITELIQNKLIKFICLRSIKNNNQTLDIKNKIFDLFINNIDYTLNKILYLDDKSKLDNVIDLDYLYLPDKYKNLENLDKLDDDLKIYFDTFFNFYSDNFENPLILKFETIKINKSINHIYNNIVKSHYKLIKDLILTISQDKINKQKLEQIIDLINIKFQSYNNIYNDNLEKIILETFEYDKQICDSSENSQCFINIYDKKDKEKIFKFIKNNNIILDKNEPE